MLSSSFIGHKLSPSIYMLIWFISLDTVCTTSRTREWATKHACLRKRYTSTNAMLQASIHPQVVFVLTSTFTIRICTLPLPLIGTPRRFKSIIWTWRSDQSVSLKENVTGSFVFFTYPSSTVARTGTEIGIIRRTSGLSCIHMLCVPF